MPKPLAVIIGDIHFQPQTLELASAAVKQAIEKALELDVPLVLNGDTTDTKVNVRGECMNRLLELLVPSDNPEIYVSVGNHDLFNEKSSDHVLGFLRPYVKVVDRTRHVVTKNGSFHIIPYMSDTSLMRNWLDVQTRGSILIMHQGVQTAFMGHYAQDKSSLPPEAFNNLRVIASHYHRRQDIKCGETGLFSYIGNPYTLSFGEAQDPEKGFAVLYSDGSLEFVPTNLRKHVVLDFHLRQLGLCYLPNPGDLVWLKLRGPESELAQIEKKDLAQQLGIDDFRLDLIPDGAEEVVETDVVETAGDTLDSLIDATGETDKQKSNLKKVWRDLLETA